MLSTTNTSSEAPSAGVPGSSMVTVMARNGVNFGIRLSGTGDQWFQAPANPVDGLFFPGYGPTDVVHGVSFTVPDHAVLPCRPPRA